MVVTVVYYSDNKYNRQTGVAGAVSTADVPQTTTRLPAIDYATVINGSTQMTSNA